MSNTQLCCLFGSPLACPGVHTTLKMHNKKINKYFTFHEHHIKHFFNFFVYIYIYIYIYNTLLIQLILMPRLSNNRELALSCKKCGCLFWYYFNILFLLVKKYRFLIFKYTEKLINAFISAHLDYCNALLSSLNPCHLSLVQNAVVIASYCTGFSFSTLVACWFNDWHIKRWMAGRSCT